MSNDEMLDHTVQLQYEFESVDEEGETKLIELKIVIAESPLPHI